jgi:hypothetical protein
VARRASQSVGKQSPANIITYGPASANADSLARLRQCEAHPGSLLADCDDRLKLVARKSCAAHRILYRKQAVDAGQIHPYRITSEIQIARREERTCVAGACYSACERAEPRILF